MRLPQKHELETNELLLLQSEMRNNEKSLAIAYLMLLGGHLGAHRFYLKRYGTGIAQLLLFLFASVSYLLGIIIAIALDIDEDELILFIVLFTYIPVFVLFVWVIVDLFLIPGMVKDWNNRLERHTIGQIAALRGRQ